MKKVTRAIYDEDYVPREEEIEKEQAQVLQQDEKDNNYLSSYLDDELSDKIDDEFKYFITVKPTPTPQDQLYDWWSEQHKLPHLRQMAYDLLSIPAMSAETERTFSNAKHIISSTRTCLGADIVEAEECLHAWYKAGM
jgi:hypothetical protein